MHGTGPMRWPGLVALLLAAAAGQCQENPYIYVKMPLTVPWALYFAFLGAVLIPFVEMIALAWRKQPPDEAGADAAPRRDRSGTEG